MYLLDTNVISELRKAGSGKANKNVVHWATSIATNTLYLSAISILELELGILLRERKDPSQGAILRTWLNSHVLTTFNGKVLPVDTAIALTCAKLHVPNPSSEHDSIIAATAIVHGMTVVTRNVVDFKASGVELINPWETESLIA